MTRLSFAILGMDGLRRREKQISLMINHEDPAFIGDYFMRPLTGIGLRFDSFGAALTDIGTDMALRERFLMSCRRAPGMRRNMGVRPAAADP